jgi:hypothetical protein
MAAMKCPDCGSQGFYIKDPEDQYNISEFDVQEGEIVFTSGEEASTNLEVGDDTETFCDRCAWHDKFKTLKRVR